MSGRRRQRPPEAQRRRRQAARRKTHCSHCLPLLSRRWFHPPVAVSGSPDDCRASSRCPSAGVLRSGHAHTHTHTHTHTHVHKKRKTRAKQVVSDTFLESRPLSHESRLARNQRRFRSSFVSVDNLYLRDDPNHSNSFVNMFLENK